MSSTKAPRLTSCWTVLGVFSLHDHLIVGR